MKPLRITSIGLIMILCTLAYSHVSAATIDTAISLALVQLVNRNDMGTVAGTGIRGGAGDGGDAIAAQLSYPYDVEVDSEGNFYILDHGNASVRRVDSTGIIQTVVGSGQNGFAGDGGPATAALLNRPHGICSDKLGNLYIADTYNNRIRKVDIHGIIVTIAGNGQDGYSGDGGLAINAKLNKPYDICVDSSGNLFIADTSNHVIRKVDSNGVITTVAGSSGFGYTGNEGPATQAKLRTPIGVFVCSKGELYIADTGNHVIRKVRTDGIIQTIAGDGSEGYAGDKGIPTRAKLSSPSSVLMDQTGLIIIADSGNHAIRAVIQGPQIVTLSGNGTPGFFGDGMHPAYAQLNFPSGIDVNDKNELYIADTKNHRIRKMGAAATLYAHAGSDQTTKVFQSIQLNGTVGGVNPPYQVNWHIEAGPSLDPAQFSSTTVEDPIFTPTTAGEYVLVFTLSDGKQQSSSDSVLVKVQGLYSVSAGFDRVVTNTMSVTLEGSVQGSDGAYGVKWSILSGPSADNNQFSATDLLETVFTPARAGTYVIELRVDDPLLGIMRDSIVVVVLAVNPPNSVFVTDTIEDWADISNYVDYDPLNKKDLVIRWNFDRNKVDFSNVSDAHVYVSLNGDRKFRFLGRTGNSDISYFVWSVDEAAKISDSFKNGPQSGSFYEFQVFFLSRNGNPIFYGPYLNSGPVRYYTKSDPSAPDPIYIPEPTPVPTEIVVVPTVPPDTNPTPTPTIDGSQIPTPPPGDGTPLPEDPNQPHPTATPSSPSNPTVSPEILTPTPGDPGATPTMESGDPGTDSTPVSTIPGTEPTEFPTQVPENPDITPTASPSGPSGESTVTPTEILPGDPTPEPTATPTRTPTPLPETVTLVGIVRDFKHNHPDFERYSSSKGEKGIVESILGEDKKPVLASGKHAQVTSEGSFKHWFEDNPGLNERTEIDIVLRLDPNSSPFAPVYSFESSSFFPIDNLLMGNQGRKHNYHFTMEVHTEFTYTGPQEFKFSGDDDVWVFINNQLVIDLGGVHPELRASVNTGDLGLEIGQIYPLDLFFAERHTTGSNFRISTGLYLEPVPEPTATPTPFPTETPTGVYTPVPTPEPTLPSVGPEIEVGPLNTYLYFVDDSSGMESLRSLSTASIVVENVGSAPLTVASVSFEQASSWLQIDPTAPFVLNPGEIKELTISVDWQQMPLGQSANRLLIESDDFDETVFPAGVYLSLEKAAPTPTPLPGSEPEEPTVKPGEPTYTPVPTSAIEEPAETPTPSDPLNPAATPTPISEIVDTPTPVIPVDPGNVPTAVPTEPVNPVATPVSDTPTPKPGNPTGATATPTVTPTPSEIPVNTPTFPPVGDPELYRLITFDQYRSKTLRSYGFTVIPKDAKASLNPVPFSSGASNGEGVACEVSIGEMLTLNGPEITVYKNPVTISVWYNIPEAGYQFALGAYGEIAGQFGSSLYTVRGMPEYTPGEWQKAEISVNGGYTKVTPFMIVYNESGTGSGTSKIAMDNLAIAQGKTAFTDGVVTPGDWKPNEWLAASEHGLAYRQNSVLVLEKDPDKAISRFVSSFPYNAYPVDFRVEIDVVKDYGESGTLTLWSGTGPNANQIDIPLWMLKNGEEKTLSLSSVSLANSEFMNVVLQIAGQDAQRVRILDVRMYGSPVDPNLY